MKLYRIALVGVVLAGLTLGGGTASARPTESARLAGPAAASLASAAAAGSSSVVISQVYGGGGNAGAHYTHDFVELFNRGTATVSLAGWSVQYTSATGTGLFGGATNLITPLSGSLAPGQYLLVQEASNAAVGAPLPTPDVTDATPILMAAGAGKVALVNTTTPLGCNGGSTPCAPAALATIVDLVGYGTGASGANFFEGSGAAPTLSATLAGFRGSNGCTDTDDNAADFAAAAPAPRTTASPLNACAPPEPKLNEFSASTVGTDVEYVEVRGAPATDYSAYTVLEIEGDAGTSVGTVDEVIGAGTTGANGLQLLSLPANALENGTISLLLVRGFTGVLNADLDTDNDGVFDVTPWAAVVDTVAVNDGGAGDVTYGAPTLGVAYDGQPFAPGGASRIPDGADTDTAADWVRNDFDLAGIPGFVGTPVVGEALNTPGAPNQAVTADANTVTIEATDGDAAEAGGATGTFRISRTGSTASALAVSYTVGGSASAADYTPALGGTAGIAAGAAFVDIVITPVDDADVEGPETVTLTLTAGTGYLLGATTSASVTIADDDAPVVVTPISSIQGSGAASAAGTFTVEAIVVGSYQAQGAGRLRGFFVQEEDADADADPATSEGIFVFCTTCPVPVSVGDRVRVTGASSEFFGMSQLTASTAAGVTVLSSGNPLPAPAVAELPVPGVPSGNLALATAAINAYFEAFEGMLVTFPDTLSVSEYFELARFGQVILSEGGRPRTFTAAHVPTAAGFVDHQIDLARRKVILDDTDNRENRPVDVPNTPYYHPVPGLSIGNYFRGGDTIANLTGVLHWSFAGLTGTDAWRIRPVPEAFGYAFTPVNTRPAVPAVSGRLKVASFNVLNYFLTIDTSNTCAPTQNQDCRGADSVQELARQRAKLLSALTALDADVFGFMEMENTPGVQPLADIVAGLPGYAYVDTGVIGTDAIRVGIIYKTSSVQPVGSHAILDSSVDPRFVDTRNRPALAQTFAETATGGRFTVVVNHLKSKGSGCGAGDDDTATGQGNCNGTRTLAARALADWLATDPTGSGDADVLIIGDLNSYAQEDPIVALRNAGYTDLVAAFGGPGAYGYVFDGQLGYLDHALSNASLTPQVTGVAEWHINADEIPLFDYNDDVRTADEATFEEESDVFPLYEPNEFRTSDHDPVIVGLDLRSPPVVTAAPASQSVQYSDPLAPVTVTGTDGGGAASLVATTQWKTVAGAFADGLPGGMTLSPATCGLLSCTWTIGGLADTAPGTYTIRVTLTDADGDSSHADVTVTVTQEDARATYTGAMFASTASPTSSTAKVVLAATIQDITAAGGDAYPGDIRNATVTFVDRDADPDAPIPGCTNLPVGLVAAADTTTGAASCVWSVDIGNAMSRSTTVGIVVGGYYTRNHGGDDSVVTVSRPLASDFVAGGGYLTLTSSAGLKAGDAGSRANFGLGVKFNRGGTNLQGTANVVVRRTEPDGLHVYQVKANVISSLSVTGAKATVTGKASIQDITDPAAPTAVDGNATLQLTLTDNGEPGSGDLLGITVWNKGGGLWFASAWNGTKTVEQTLAGGNLRVR